MSIEPKDQDKKIGKSSNQYMKYAGLAMTMFFSMFIMWFLGSKIDAYFGNETEYIGLAFLVLTLFTFLYKLVKELS